MRLKINRSKADADSIIRMNTAMLIEPIFLDITQGNSSQRILNMENEEKYLLFFSRPILFNIFKLPLYDYEFRFSIEQSENPEESFVKGAAKPKKYIIGAILIVVLIFLYRITGNLMDNYGFDLFLYVLIPLYALIYFTTGYLYFKNKVKKEILVLLAKN
jgi:hypothetical protein